MKEYVLPADTFIVVNKTILTELDRKIITMLYQPIIGSIATNLYFTFWSYLDKSEIMSNQITHHNLMTNMKLALDDIINSREKLEAIGLVKTYFKKGSINTYIYEIYSPLPANEFFNNPILDVTLSENVGEEEYKKLTDYFKLPYIKLDGYEDITCSFTDIFEPVIKSLHNDSDEYKKINNNKLKINSDLELNSIFELIPEELLNKSKISHDTKSLILKLAYIYNLDNNEMTDIIINSIEDDKTINIVKLKDNCRKYYSFETKGKMPSLIYKTQPESLRKNITDTTTKSKMIYKFETISPYELLYEKNNDTEPSLSEMKIVEFLIAEQKLNPGVVNVLIDYVLRINDNKLTKAFVTTISSQWVRKNIKTVEQAMEIASKENKSKRNYVQPIKKIEKTPEWFGKNIEEDVVSEEEQLEFEKRIKNMK